MYTMIRQLVLHLQSAFVKKRFTLFQPPMKGLFKRKLHYLKVFNLL